MQGIPTRSLQLLGVFYMSYHLGRLPSLYPQKEVNSGQNINRSWRLLVFCQQLQEKLHCLDKFMRPGQNVTFFCVQERVDRQGGSVSLWRCYWKAYWPMVVLGGIFRLLSDMCMFVSPMLIDDIVLYVQNYRTSLQNGGNETTQATNDVSKPVLDCI